MNGGDRLRTRLGLSVPNEWWPARPIVKEIESAGFEWIQLSAPPASVLADPRSCIAHARALERTLCGARLRRVLHAPTDLLAGEGAADRALEGALSYAAECGAELVVYHARALLDGPAADDRLLAETGSLATLGPLAERLGLILALENLAPVFPGRSGLSRPDSHEPRLPLPRGGPCRSSTSRRRAPGAVARPTLR